MKRTCLLIDNSNTRTKFMLHGDGGDAPVRMLNTAEITVEQVKGVLAGWRFDAVCLCSVVPAAAEVIASALAVMPSVRLSVHTARGVDFSSYPGVETLGADRVANVLAAVKRAPLPLVAVDLGTASTFDVVLQGEDGPVFAGGLIAPGLSAMATSLHQRTALLPEIDPTPVVPVIGRTTRDSMVAALRVGYPAMVDGILVGIEKEIGQSANVLLTGGDAAFLAPLLRHQVTVVPSLTLEGIALVADMWL